MFAESIRQHSLRNAGAILGTHVIRPDPGATTSSVAAATLSTLSTIAPQFQRYTQAAVNSTSRYFARLLFQFKFLRKMSTLQTDFF